MRDTRLRVAVGVVTLVLFVLALVALNDDEKPQRVVADEVPETTVSSIDTTTSSTSEPEPGTTSSSASTLPASPTTRVTRGGTGGTAPVATTTPPRPLVLTRVDPSIAAPCHNPSTTTTAGNGGTGVNEIDGCHYFIRYPLDQRDLYLTLRSDRGVAQPLPTPCQTTDNVECQVYISLSGDRAVGDRECFFLTATAPGWASRSNDVCIVWPKRGQ